jgi:outer membrane protein TolC
MEAHHVAELYVSRILPAARDHIEAARIAFEAGNAPFLEVVQAEKNLRASELAYLETLADWSRRRAELARTLGELPPDSGVNP